MDALTPLPSPSSRGERLRGAATGLFATGILLPSLFAFNLAQTLSLVVKPFSQKGFRAFNRWGANTWWGWCVSAAKALYGTHIVLTGDEVPKQENAIVVANHQQMSDITFLMFLARSKERLGDMKWFVKDVVKYVPGVGWGMLFLDCLFVKRDWMKDKNSIRQTFSRLVDGAVPVWLVSFVEGTRITEDKRRRSQDYARKNGLPLLERVLLPRTKGFVASVRGLGEHITAVYDVTIGYAGGSPSIWQYIQGFAREAHFHVRRYARETLPSTDEGLADWLVQRFQEKDELLKGFEAKGHFPVTSSTQA